MNWSLDELWPSEHKPPIHRKHWIYVTRVQSSMAPKRILIASATSNARNNWTRRTSRSQLEIIERILARYCSMASQTGSPTRLEFMRVISTAYDRNDLAYRERSSAHNFARVRPIGKIKLPLWSAINVLSDGIIISVLTKCGEWVVYA